MRLHYLLAALVGVGLALAPSAVIADDGVTSMSADTADVVPLAASSCPSNYFCIWPSSNYGGTMVKYGVVNSYRDINLSTVGSYYNHRVDRSWMFELDDGSGRSLCVDPGDRSPTVPAWALRAQSLYLSLVVAC